LREHLLAVPKNIIVIIMTITLCDLKLLLNVNVVSVVISNLSKTLF
jgi:hypothetical protein